jgi:hypothetical protein
MHLEPTHQVLLQEGGVYMDTDHVMVRGVDELLEFDSVWGRQAENEHGHQVGYGMLRMGYGMLRMVDRRIDKFVWGGGVNGW